MRSLVLFICLFISSAKCDPYAKVLVHAMDKEISDHIAWDNWPKWSQLMAKYFTQDMVYDTNYFDGTNKYMGNGTGIWSWWLREHIPINEAFDNQTFTQIIFAAEDNTATHTTYAIAPWTKGPFIGLKPPQKVVQYRIFDFYKLKNGKISYNWMILDTVHLLLEAGYDVLPNNKSPLKQGWVRPPNAMDGVPAPLSITVNPHDAIIAKKLSLEAMYFDLTSENGHPSPLWLEDMKFYGSHGIGVAENVYDYHKYFVHAINTAFTDRNIQLDLIVCEGRICGAHGYLIGNFTKPFLGEKPANVQTRLRFGLHWHVDVETKHIIEGYGIFDLPGFFIQGGIDLFARAHQKQKAYSEPHTKTVIRAMDKEISDHVAWDDWTKWNEIFTKYFTQDMIYDTNYFDGTNHQLGNGTGIRSWYDREHIPINMAFDNQTFNQIIFAADDETATTTTYTVSPWTKGPFLGVDPPQKIVRYRIFDFYRMKNGMIWYNWMILDTVHLLYEAGFDVLPNNINPLKQGWVRPPNSMDGIPAPLSITVNPEDTIISKKLALEAMYFDLTSGESHPSPLWRNDMTWYGSHGFGVAENIDDYYKYFIFAINTAFTDRKIDLDLMVCEGTICGAHGYLVGNFTGPFLGEKPANVQTRLRFGLHWHIDTEEKRIIEGYGIFDLPGFFVQGGVDLFKRAHDEQQVKIVLLKD
jgi:predicted ester cyclase